MGERHPELVVPDDARTELQVLTRTDAGGELTATLPVAGRITSNVHAVGTLGGIQVGVARAGALRVWRYI